MHAVTRRTMLGGALGGAAVVGVGAPLPHSRSAGARSPFLFHSPPSPPFRDEVPRLPVLDGTDLSVAARSTQHRFHRDYDLSPALGYGDRSYLGPVIEARSGVQTSVRLRNRMGEHPFAADVDLSLHGVPEDFGSRPPTTLHLHGGVTRPRFDGHPEDFIVPGEALRNRYGNGQEAGSLWYHDHTLGTTRLNVYAGLAAPYLIRDEFDTGGEDNPLGLPAGEFEWPLVLQEKVFADGGRQSVRSVRLVPQGSWEGGAVGDRGLINGVVWPQLKVARGLYRFRIYNAASLSVWNLHFSDRRRFWVIGNDLGLLDAPAPTREVRMGPAERIDILVDFSDLRAGESVELRNDEPVPLPAAAVGAKPMPLFGRFVATSERGHTGPVPTRLRGGSGRPAVLSPVARPERSRDLTLIQDLDRRFPPTMMLLNNLHYDDEDIERPVQGTVEEWNLINTTPDPHTIHPHLVHFRVIERQRFSVWRYKLANHRPPVGTRWTPSADRFAWGSPSAPKQWESGPKDTVHVDPHTITRILVRWPDRAELGFDPDQTFVPAGAEARMATTMPMSTAEDGRLGGYMWHCHMLDHEDHDMMARFRLVTG